MLILKNAINSIQLGLEDYELSKTDTRRIVSAARNFHAGILLLMKYKLSLLSPDDSEDVLIKKKIKPKMENGELIWIGDGKKTVDIQDIKERFKFLNIDFNWATFDDLTNERNNLEHYYTNSNSNIIENLVSSTFPLLNDFIRDHLDRDPEALLGDDAWNVLTEKYDLYLKNKESKEQKFEILNYYSETILSALKEYRCNCCGSEFILPIKKSGSASETHYKCTSCETVFSYETLTSLAINEMFSTRMHYAFKDGEESPIWDCPECCGAYLYEEGICSICGHEANHCCEICGDTTDELDEICSYCSHIQYQIQKD
ncbi:hypothetical protein F480_06160 [Bibersteinia trehalosi Y31]|uniref:Uncharacterized protein n=1 Tax=Bibersteinia trehalosi Y31 TaxID=1261658 RepID=A0A179CYC4_BIBTR|nr:hypothetical protein [Bibersteinia trehalosi]OAQ14899.1 hypothetical protein F480_06160 [Bibersteinia trehalosi Y31]